MLSVFCHELTVVLFSVMFLLEGEFLEGSRGSKEEEEESVCCKDQGGEGLVAVLFLFFWKTESKRGVEVR